MANSLNSLNTSYSGEFAGKYLSAALLSANTIDKGGIEVKPNIKYKSVMKKVATGAVIANASCDFTKTDDAVTITERILQPSEYQVNMEFCKKDFAEDWEAVQMGYSAFDNMPPQFSDYIIGHVAGMVAEKTEQNIWEGTNATAGEFDGLATLALADTDVLDVTGTTVDAANVVAELGKIVDSIPASLYGKEDVHIYISQNIARAYVRALGGFAATNSGVNAQSHMWYGDGALSFDGVKLFVANGLNDNTAMAAQKSNLFFGTGLLSDMNEVKLIDMADIDGSQNVRVVMRYTAGVQYGIGSDIVLYHV
jgi:hypothetical protein